MALDFFAGCLGGCANVIVGHPLDTVKVHLQTQDHKNPRYKGGYHCFKSLLITDGVRGLYRGVSSPLAGVAGINAIVFGTYGIVQRCQKDPNALSSCLVAGASAGLLQSFLTSPVELAKTRAQISSNKGPMQILRDIYTSEGVRGIFRGLNITMIREVPAFASYFWTFEYLTRTADNSPVSTATMLIAGGMAGVISWIICYPVDVIKSRLQVDGMNGNKTYKNSYDCLKKCVLTEGYSVLFRGLAPTLVRAFPVNAACFTVVTWTLRLFNTETSNEVYEKSMWDVVLYNAYMDSAGLLC